MTQQFISPCKINLGLEVLRKRADGYHELNTVFLKVQAPHDTLHIQESNSFLFTSNDTNIPTNDDNLVVRAFKLCALESSNQLPNVHIHLEKQIPTGAGLGGGSGDAATAIKMYSSCVRELTSVQQFEIAKRLGADVPFFLQEDTAMVAGGIGDILTPITFALNHPLLIVSLKQLPISTADAYSKLRLIEHRLPTELTRIIQSKPVSDWRDRIINDFEEVAFGIHPILKPLKSSLYRYGAAFALMSGSGSAFFAIFESQEVLMDAHEKILIEYPSASVYHSV
ncbi:MAG: 4-(cytidine 5'-diphospho)-2-C-methyl-D-erythritol kinase [bacterium]